MRWDKYLNFCALPKLGTYACRYNIRMHNFFFVKKHKRSSFCLNGMTKPKQIKPNKTKPNKITIKPS